MVVAILATMFSQKFCDSCSTGLHKVLLRFGERSSKIALDITLHHRRPRQITRIFSDIVHDYDLTAASRCTAQSLAKRDARIGCKAAEGPTSSTPGSVGSTR